MHIGFLASFHAISPERSGFSKIATLHFQALVALKLLVSLISRLVVCSPRFRPDTQTDRRTDGQTDRQNDYCNPRCACAPRVNYDISQHHVTLDSPHCFMCTCRYNYTCTQCMCKYIQCTLHTLLHIHLYMSFTCILMHTLSSHVRPLLQYNNYHILTSALFFLFSLSLLLCSYSSEV